MRFLFRFWQHVSSRKVEPLPVKLPRGLGKHRNETLHRLFPYFALVTECAIEGMQFSRAPTFANAHLDPTARHQIKSRDTLGDTSRMVSRELNDAVPQANVFGALADGGQKYLRR